MWIAETARAVSSAARSPSGRLARGLALSCAISAAACSAVPSAARLADESTVRGPHVIAIDMEAASRGAPIYTRNCETCHGRFGDGRGPSAGNMNPQPQNFVMAMFMCQSTPNGSLPLPVDLRRTVAAGIHGAAMPAWSVLGEAQVYEVVEYIRTFSPRWRTEPVPPPVAISVSRQRAWCEHGAMETEHGAMEMGAGNQLSDHAR